MPDPTHNLTQIAHDYAALLAAGEMLAAAEKYWADDIVALEPAGAAMPDGAVAIGKPAALAWLTRWLAANSVSELMVDGPFITGNQFALFIDMQITRRVTGKREPFSQIATYHVRDGQIAEQRCFYV